MEWGAEWKKTERERKFDAWKDWRRWRQHFRVSNASLKICENGFERNEFAHVEMFISISSSSSQSNEAFAVKLLDCVKFDYQIVDQTIFKSLTAFSALNFWLIYHFILVCFFVSTIEFNDFYRRPTVKNKNESQKWKWNQLICSIKATRDRDWRKGGREREEEKRHWK